MTHIEKLRVRNIRHMVFDLIEHLRKHPNPSPAFLDGLIMNFREAFHMALK